MSCSIYNIQLLGFPSSQFPQLEQELGLSLDPDEEQELQWANPRAKADFNQVIRRAQIDTLATIGWEVHAYNGTPSSISFKHRDTGEVREFNAAHIELFWNEGDLGQSFDQALIGIQIAGDFHPILIDHPYKSGRLNAELLPDRLALVEHFRKRLVELQSPLWEQAQIHETEVFY